MGGAGVDTGCPPYCSAHACLQDKAEFKDKLSPVALSVALTLPKEPPGLVLYGHTLVQAQVGGTWLWGDVTMVTPGGLIPTAGPGHMWVPPAWVWSALGSPVCASVPNTTLGHCSRSSPPLSPFSTGMCPHTVPATPWHVHPVLPSACSSVSSLFPGCPLCTQHCPHSQMQECSSVPSAIPNPSPGCAPLSLLPPWHVSVYVPRSCPWMPPLLSPFFPLRDVTSLSSIPSLSVSPGMSPLYSALSQTFPLECPLWPFHQPNLSLGCPPRAPFCPQ